MRLGKDANKSDIEPEIVKELIVSGKDRHNELPKRVNKDVGTGESYQKPCTIDNDVDQYMGKTIR